MPNAWILLPGVLTLAGHFYYVRSILRGNTHPSRVTWWIWTAVGVLLCATYYDLGGRAALGMAVGGLGGQILVASLSLKYGRGGMTGVDWVSIAGAAVALLLWAFFPPAFPHMLLLLIDFFGWIPTFRKVLVHPRSETVSAWALWSLGAAISLLLATDGNFWDIPFPLYLLVSNVAIVLVILRFKFRPPRISSPLA